jgi:hypothetical protein
MTRQETDMRIELLQSLHALEAFSFEVLYADVLQA